MKTVSCVLQVTYMYRGFHTMQSLTFPKRKSMVQIVRCVPVHIFQPKDEMRKEIYFPEAKRLGDLFSEVKPYTGQSRVIKTLTEGVDECRVRSYCTVTGVNGRDALDVTPTKKVLDFIEQNMLIIEPGTYFEMVQRDNGETLVMVKCDSIIGSRWLAVIPSTEVPAYTRMK